MTKPAPAPINPKKEEMKESVLSSDIYLYCQGEYKTYEHSDVIRIAKDASVVDFVTYLRVSRGLTTNEMRKKMHFFPRHAAVIHVEDGTWGIDKSFIDRYIEAINRLDPGLNKKEKELFALIYLFDKKMHPESLFQEFKVFVEE